MAHQAGSRESVNGEQGEKFRWVDGVEDVLKREVLSTCAVAWCKGSLRGTELLAELKREGFTGCSVMRIAGAAYLLMFMNEEDRRDMLSRPVINQWFTKVEEWKPGVQIGSWSVWLSMVGIPMNLWSEGTFQSIAQVWGSLEVEVVYSHDLICNCADSDTVVSSYDNQWEFDQLQSMRDNLTFAPVMMHNPVEVDGVANWDEWVGMVERNIELRSDHMDVMWGSQPELEPPKWNTAQVRYVTVAENQEQMLELEWNTQLDKDLDFSISNLNLMEKSAHFTIALTYSDSDLVPVPISIVSALVVPEVHVVVTNGVARKVRSINEVTIATRSEEQRGVPIKARGTNRRGNAKAGSVAGGSFVNCSLSYSDIQARQQAIRREVEATLQLELWWGGDGNSGRGIDFELVAYYIAA
ncbi:hypothetical protein V6N13_041474 [Hibiscus sabdariffa]